MGRNKELIIKLGDNLNDIINAIENSKNHFSIFVRINKAEDENAVAAALHGIDDDAIVLNDQSILVNVNKLTSGRTMELHSFLFDVDAEMVLWYFSNDERHFINTVKNAKKTELLQTRLITADICDIIVSWVTNEFHMCIYFDSDALFEHEVLKMLKRGGEI